MEVRYKQSCVILVLKDTRLLVDRELLTQQSFYFSALLSEKYKDHLQTEHVLNYDIPISALRDYISWIYDKDVCTLFGFTCKLYLKRYCDRDWKSYEHLVKLLHLSVLFATDRLTEEISLIIETTLVKPDYVLGIWLAATELGLCMLRDIFFDACLDYFDKLPFDELLHLECRNLRKLLQNKNIVSSMDHVQNILRLWMRVNKFESLHEPFLIKDKYPRILHCIIDHDTLNNYSNSEILLYCWDGCRFFKHSTIMYPKEMIDRLNEMQLRFNSPAYPIKNMYLHGVQFTSRRYSIYICGGEYCAENAIFGNMNDKIWRYSLISKKWYFETFLSKPRRNMLIVSAKNKLYFIGGRNMGFVHTVNIYDVHDQTWTKGLPAPISVLNNISHCVSNNKLIILSIVEDITIHIYNIIENTWLLYVYDIGCYIHLRDCDMLLELNREVPHYVLVHDNEESKCRVGKGFKMAVKWFIHVSETDECHENYRCQLKTPLYGPQYKLHCDYYKTQVYLLRDRRSHCQCVKFRYFYILYSENREFVPGRYPVLLLSCHDQYKSSQLPIFHMHTVYISEPVQWRKSEYRNIKRIQFSLMLDPAELHAS